MPRKRPAELKIIGEKLTDLFEETLTEPLPKRWQELIERLNERELGGDDRRKAREDDPPS